MAKKLRDQRREVLPHQALFPYRTAEAYTH